MAQSLPGAVAALYAACSGTVYAGVAGADGNPVLVVRAGPGQYQPAAIVAVASEIRAPITRPTNGTGRSRDTTAEVDVIMSVYVSGGEEAQDAADAAAWDLLSRLEAYLRASPNETLGSTCYDSWVAGSTLIPEVAWQTFDDPNMPPVIAGRIAELTATVAIRIRY
jgi:hypothetical protein